jgi:hypothetical protein
MLPMTPLEMLRLSLQTGVMMAEAQMVIAMRVMGMAGMWRVTPGENSRMVNEKLHAGVQSAAAATRIAMSGGSISDVAHAALRPVRRATKSNVNRLAKRGPGAPS